MKRPNPDEPGTPPHDLTKSHCVHFFGAPKKDDKASVKNHKKLICPDHGFRQFNGDEIDFSGNEDVPRKRPKNRQRSIRPLVAGISWGLKEDKPGYCTVGAILCSKTDKTKRFFISNQHCLDMDLFEDIDLTGKHLIALQPSAAPQDEVENPKAKKPEEVGHVVFGERTWREPIDTFRDTVVVELASTVPAKARVMVGDPADRMKQESKRVLGIKTIAEVAKLKAEHKDLKFCISGRSGGWGCFTVKEVSDKHDDEFIEMEHEHGSENINPHFLYGGNSGSVFWYKDPKEDGYWAVGLFSGMKKIDPIDLVLASIHAKGHLDLTVCTHDTLPKNAHYKGKKDKKDAKQKVLKHF
jgi:hypothetical protein